MIENSINLLVDDVAFVHVMFKDVQQRFRNMRDGFRITRELGECTVTSVVEWHLDVLEAKLGAQFLKWYSWTIYIYIYTCRVWTEWVHGDASSGCFQMRDQAQTQVQIQVQIALEFALEKHLGGILEASQMQTQVQIALEFALAFALEKHLRGIWEASMEGISSVN